MTWLHQVNSLNKMRARVYPSQPLKGSLFGFKFHFRGRFSRKQRAGSFLVSKGNMPLTTLSSHIDYAFLTMPLDNSVVSIKVWLFRNFLDRDISLGSFSFFKLIRIPYKIFLEYRMKALLKKYKTFLINKKKAWKSRKFWFKRRKKKELFSFYKVSNEDIEDSSTFNMKNLDVRSLRFFRKFNTSLFFKNFYFSKKIWKIKRDLKV